jgi:hypothetical protein
MTSTMERLDTYRGHVQTPSGPASQVFATGHPELLRRPPLSGRHRGR